jgi:hypothetical protein
MHTTSQPITQFPANDPVRADDKSPLYVRLKFWKWKQFCFSCLRVLFRVADTIARNTNRNTTWHKAKYRGADNHSKHAKAQWKACFALKQCWLSVGALTRLPVYFTHLYVPFSIAAGWYGVITAPSLKSPNHTQIIVHDAVLRPQDKHRTGTPTHYSLFNRTMSGWAMEASQGKAIFTECTGHILSQPSCCCLMTSPSYSFFL